MNTTNKNAAPDPPEAPQQEAGPIQEPNLLSDEEVFDRHLVRLKKIFDKVEVQNIPGTEASPVSRRPPRQSSKRRSSKPRARSGHSRARASSSRRALNRSAHESRCTVCCHPYRENIEEEFIHWHSPYEIGKVYDLEQRSIYRHAHALNLFAVRDRNLRFALGHIIDEAERCFSIKAGDIVRAVHAFARVNDQGQWVEPPSHIIVSSGARPAPPRRPQLAANQQPALPPQKNAKTPAENSASSPVNLGRTEHPAND